MKLVYLVSTCVKREQNKGREQKAKGKWQREFFLSSYCYLFLFQKSKKSVKSAVTACRSYRECDHCGVSVCFLLQSSWSIREKSALIQARIQSKLGSSGARSAHRYIHSRYTVYMCVRVRRTAASVSCGLKPFYKNFINVSVVCEAVHKTDVERKVAKRYLTEIKTK